MYICSLFVCHWLKACTGSLVGRDKYFSDIFKTPRDTKRSGEACLHVQDGTLHLRNGDIFISKEICSWYDLDIFQLVLKSGLAELHKACRSVDQTRGDGAKVILVNYCCKTAVLSCLSQYIFRVMETFRRSFWELFSDCTIGDSELRIDPSRFWKT